MLIRLAFLLVCLAVPVTGGHAQTSPYQFKTDIPAEVFAARRAKIYDAIGPDAVALVQGAPAVHSSARFRQSNQFFYLTGVETPHAFVLLDGRRRRTTLFLPHHDAARAGTDGRVLTADDADDVRRLTGVDAVAATDQLAAHLAGLARRATAAPAVFTPFSPAEGPAASRDGELRAIGDRVGDAWDGRPAREGHLRHLLRTRFPALEVRDLSPILDELRLIKDEYELRLIRQATFLSGQALVEAMRSTRPGTVEHELDAVARFIFFRHGAQGEGYAAIVATGANAYTPHHRAADTVLEDGDLVLMDYAPDLAYYRTDITRMWPVNGRWSPVQRELYGFYLGCYRAILDRIRPHVTAQQIRAEAAADMQALLARTTFTSPVHARAAARFVEQYAAGARPGTYLGHWVGMSTHDPGDYTGPLKPGMVFTIEPALRVPEEMIYIRLEDLIIIHEDRAEIVSDWVPMDLDEIERIMAEPGLLEQYPRLVLPESKP